MGGGTPWGLVGGECMQWDAHHGVGAMHIIGGDAIGLGGGGVHAVGSWGMLWVGGCTPWGMHAVESARKPGGCTLWGMGGCTPWGMCTVGSGGWGMYAMGFWRGGCTLKGEGKGYARCGVTGKHTMGWGMYTMGVQAADSGGKWAGCPPWRGGGGGSCTPTLRAMCRGGGCCRATLSQGAGEDSDPRSSQKKAR